MDDEDRLSASSAESERDNTEQPDEEVDNSTANVNGNENDEGDNDDDNNDDDDENMDDDDEGGDDEAGDSALKTEEGNSNGKERAKSKTPSPPQLDWRPVIRPEIFNARSYDIVPTMAAPQSTSINAMSMTPDLRYWFTGGSDGYIRKYDGPGTLNGKLPLTVAQRHPFVDSVVKAGILMSYWENEEPGMPEPVLSPVYSLAVESRALWLLSGLESGAINLQSVRHDEGKKICSLQQHTNAVSVLTMAQDEQSVLSGSWDKTMLDWDLNTGQVIRSFLGTAGQISTIEHRPACGDPVPEEAMEQPQSSTISTNNAAPFTNGGSFTNGADDQAPPAQQRDASKFAPEAAAAAASSPANESLFGGSDAGSLFGDAPGDAPFGQDDDQFGEGMGMGDQEAGMGASEDLTMAGMEEQPKQEEDKKAEVETKAEDAKPAEESEPDENAPKPEADAMEIDSAPEPKTESQPPGEEGASSTQPTELNTTQGDTETLPATEQPSEQPSSAPIIVTESGSQPRADPSQTSLTTFLSSAMDGTIRIWDRRVPDAVARISPKTGVPPWCMSACWSHDGNMVYADRRNGTVEEYDIRHARRGWEPERILKFPAGSGAVSYVKPMVNGRHLIW